MVTDSWMGKMGRTAILLSVKKIKAVILMESVNDV